jgi:DNA-binding response OmpR family regulator
VRLRAPDLIILDVMLPGKSGTDILAEIRADADFADTPVLMLTVRGQVKDRETAERAGADKYMTKPFSNADLLAAVRELVQA